MRILLTLVVLLSSLQISAKMVLVTSFRKNKEQVKAEKLFRKKIKLAAGEELQVIHKADQWALHNVLRDPSVEALFWISHGVSGRSNQTVDGATLLPKLLDYRGDNVAPVFSLIGTSLKFVSIVGCNSATILQQNGVDVSDIAHYVPTNKKVALHLQVGKSIEAFRKADLSVVREQHPELSQGSITITRDLTSSQDIRSLRVYAGSKLLGLIPATSGESAFMVPMDATLKIKLESGQDPSAKQTEIGDLSVSSSDIPGQWTLFANAQGVPFGVNHRLFIYRR